MNKTQVQTILAPVIGAFATYLASKFPLLDQATWNTLIGTIAVTGVSAFIGYITRPQALKDTTANLANTTVVTDKASADALPNNKDVIAVTPELASAIKKAS